MKIKKLTESKKLTELSKADMFDDEDLDSIADLVSEVPAATKITDTKTVKKAIELDAKAQGLQSEDNNVEDILDEVEQIEDFYDIEIFSPLGVDGLLYETLDDQLAAAMANRVTVSALSSKSAKNAAFARLNVLVEGLPGSGKTAIVKHWATARGINLHPINAKSDGLELAINGAIMRDMRMPTSNAITTAYSEHLAPLERPNSVLFLDELNRQLDSQIRASLLTLVGEHCIYGKVAGVDSEEADKETQGYHFFKNLLFTVACINPPCLQDPGADQLNSAELSRYLKTIKYDSNKKDAESYFTWHYNNLIDDLNKKSPYFLINWKRFDYQKKLALHIVKDSRFKFDQRSDLKELYDKHCTMLNQRLLADAIASLEYMDRHKRDGAAQMLNWLGTAPAQEVVDKSKQNPASTEVSGQDGLSNLLPRDAETLRKIIRDFVYMKDDKLDAWERAYRARHSKKGEEQPAKEVPAAADTDDGEEADSEMFGDTPKISDDEVDAANLGGADQWDASLDNSIQDFENSLTGMGWN